VPRPTFSAGLSDDALDVFSECVQAPYPGTSGVLKHLGGAMSRVGAADTAFAHRQYPYNFAIWSTWPNSADSASYVDWTRKFWDAMRPYMAPGVYVNYLEDEEGGNFTMALATLEADTGIRLERTEER
jgi:hypothetical protein